MSIWDLADLPYRPGLGKVVTALSNGLAAAENEAQEIFNEEQTRK